MRQFLTFLKIHLLLTDRSFSQRLVIPFAIVLTICLSVLGYQGIKDQEGQLMALTDAKINIILDFISESSRSHIVNYDTVALGELAKKAVQFDEIDVVNLVDADKAKLAEAADKNPGVSKKTMEVQIKDHGDKLLGTMHIDYNYDNVINQIKTSRQGIIIEYAVLILLLVIFIFFYVRVVIAPINRIRVEMETNANSNNEDSTLLSRTAERLSTVSNEQSAAIQETVSSMAEMQSMVKQTLGHVRSSQNLSANIKRRTSDGSVIMENLSHAMHDVETSNAQLEQLSVIMQKISRKTNVINDIVFKTQLLSFNASIEAARAGSHGRGFSVVAEEVAKLAEISGNAANEIEELLNDSKTQVQKIIAEVTEKVKEGKGVSEKATSTFQEITKDVSSISESIEQITIASTEQEAGLGQISIAMGELNKTASENSSVSVTIVNLADKNKEKWSEVNGAIQGLVVGKKRVALNQVGADQKRGSMDASHKSNSPLQSQDSSGKSDLFEAFNAMTAKLTKLEASKVVAPMPKVGGDFQRADDSEGASKTVDELKKSG